MTPHELRRTAASLAVAEGANVKAVQRMLGHAAAAMTLDVYADLLEDDLDQVADRLDRADGRAADSMRTESLGPDLDAVRLGSRKSSDEENGWWAGGTTTRTNRRPSPAIRYR
ncbi:tyrosine-type recombinase/integrase [Micromonospora pattaloongensis]|uniref:tyrosine-type recombinase/integrase n=1 Tax=Micromonospora pattaloongensis TaxID=405436 RepID=UPI00248206F3|nr:tyrosine-type recombinase/integrase [Micromonospora pattaloongensis]